ncbi:coiled-coil domain-containing protein [Saccharopolyspora pogona]|uniref:hypothetical protein n=1 Tax=Saccharopolyspora pogona TaxID=333966 RepID=UPI001CC244A5|nr:hypothetical protein [Saccharopolyspora pogona]
MSSRASKRRKAEATVAAGIDSGNQGGEGDGSAPTDQAAQDARIAERKRKKKEENARQVQARKADVARVAELKGKGQLNSKEKEELAELEPKVEQRKRNKQGKNARQAQKRKNYAARVAELKGKGQLDSEEKKELAELEPKVEQRKQQLRESNAKRSQGKKAGVARVAELKGKGQLDSEEEKELAELEPKEEQWKRMNREGQAARRATAAAEIAKLEKLEKLGRLTSEKQTELNLRREIATYTKKKRNLQKQELIRSRAAEEIKALEALPESIEVEDRLEMLREQVFRLADVAEPLKETMGRLAEKKKKLNGLGRIAGLEASGRQDEQDAMELSGVSESAGAGREASPVGSVDLDERLEQANADLGVSRDAGSAEQSGADRDAWSDGGVDVGASFDEVVGDSGGEGRAAASSSVSGEDGQTGLGALQESDAAVQAEWGETQGGLGEVEQEQVGSATRDGGQDLRVAQLRESLEDAESELASLKALPRWDEVLRAELATLPMFDQGLRGRWEKAQRRIEGLQAELAEIADDKRRREQGGASQDAAVQAEWGETQGGLGEVEQEQVGSATRDGGQDLRVAQLRESLEDAESELASLKALPRWDEVLRAELATLPMFDQGLRGRWEKAQRRIEGLQAELAEMTDDASGTAPVWEWSDSDVRGEIERARQLDLFPEDKDAVRLIVQGTHDIRRLAGRGAAVSVDEVVALVAAKRRELGGDHRGQVVEFSRLLAERLGTNAAKGGSGLSIQAGAGPADQGGRLGESAAGSGRHTSGGPSQSDAAVPVDDTAGGAGDQRGPEEQAASTVVEIRERIAALQDAVELLEARKAELEAVQGRDEDRQALWESERALRAEVAVLQAELAKFVPDGIARLAELTGRMERHLGAMPSDFDPNGVRANVETAKNMVRQGHWTSADLQNVEESLPGVEAAEGRLRNARRAKVREVYVRAKRAIAQGQGRVPVTYFGDGVPGGVSSRSDVRLGFEVEFKLPGDDFDARVDSLGAELEREGLVDWQTAHGSKLLPYMEDYEEILFDGKWALQEEEERFEVEATSPILRNDTKRPVSEQVWPSMEKLLSAIQRQGGYGSESGGHINVSFDWQLTPVQYVRVAQVAKVFEALLFRLGNVAGGDESKQRDVTYAGPIPLPSDPYAVDGTGADGYDSLPNPDDKYRAVRFGAVGFDSDRLEFRVWAGDAGELTGNPGLWQVRAELSAAMMLAGTDPAIYRELDRLMGDPDLLGYDDQSRDEGAWLEKLAEFLELLPLSEAAQAQTVQLFAWTRPWKFTDRVSDYPALIVGLPQQSVLFPGPDASKAQIVAKAYSYQLYKDTSLVVARMTSDRSGIRLRNGVVIDFELFARFLEAYKVGDGWYGEGMWTLLAIPRASGALLSAVLRVVKGPVLATKSGVYRTPDGRLLAGDYERQGDGSVRFRPAGYGWIEFINNEDDPSQAEPSRVTYKYDLGEALMDCRTRLLPDNPAEVYPYWPARGSGS